MCMQHKINHYKFRGSLATYIRETNTMIHMTAITHHRFVIDRLHEAIDKFDCYLSARALKNRKENISDPTKLIGLEM